MYKYAKSVNSNYQISGGQNFIRATGQGIAVSGSIEQLDLARKLLSRLGTFAPTQPVCRRELPVRVLQISLRELNTAVRHSE